jgi:hypothetical protein
MIKIHSKIILKTNLFLYFFYLTKYSPIFFLSDRSLPPPFTWCECGLEFLNSTFGTEVVWYMMIMNGNPLIVNYKGTNFTQFNYTLLADVCVNTMKMPGSSFDWSIKEDFCDNGRVFWGNFP